MSELSRELITENRVNTDIKMSCPSLVTGIIVELLIFICSLPHIGSAHCLRRKFWSLTHDIRSSIKSDTSLLSSCILLYPFLSFALSNISKIWLSMRNPLGPLPLYNWSHFSHLGAFCMYSLWHFLYCLLITCWHLSFFYYKVLLVD